MSLKSFEDKSQRPSELRELRDLHELTQALTEAVRLRAKERAASLLEQVSTAWSRGNALQLKVSADAAYPHRQEILVQLADALNAAQRARADGLGLVGILGTPR